MEVQNDQKVEINVYISNGNPPNGHRDILLKTTNVNIMVVLEQNLHQTHF